MVKCVIDKLAFFVCVCFTLFIFLITWSYEITIMVLCIVFGKEKCSLGYKFTSMNKEEQNFMDISRSLFSYKIPFHMCYISVQGVLLMIT